MGRFSGGEKRRCGLERGLELREKDVFDRLNVDGPLVYFNASNWGFFKIAIPPFLSSYHGANFSLFF